MTGVRITDFEDFGTEVVMNAILSDSALFADIFEMAQAEETKKRKDRRFFPSPERPTFRVIKSYPPIYRIGKKGMYVDLTMEELGKLWCMAKEDYDSTPKNPE